MGFKRQQTKEKQARGKDKKDKPVKENPRKEDVKKSGKKKSWRDRQALPHQSNALPHQSNKTLQVRYCIYIDGKALPTVETAEEALNIVEGHKSTYTSRMMVVELTYTVGLKVVFECHKDGTELNKKEVEEIKQNIYNIENDVLKGKEIYIWSEDDFAS